MKKLNEMIRLKHLIIAVIVLAFILFVVSSIYSSYKGNINLLEEHSLETNQVYAQKLAQMVNFYLSESLERLEYSAEKVKNQMDNPEALLDEVNRLQHQSQTFNSVIVANADGLILAGAPEKFELTGKYIESKEGKEVIKNQKPSISNPYKAATGRILITISQPIFSDEGNYLGLINGTIYINESNFFHIVLGDHTYKNGSYVYVVNTDGNIIYHYDPNRIGTNVSENQVVQKIMKGESGAQKVINSLGVEMLAGFSSIEDTHWGIIVQTPQKVAIQSVGQLVKKLFLIELPFIIFSIIVVYLFAKKIVKPLQQMAKIVENSMNENVVKKLTLLNSWYYEVLQIKNALIESFSFLHGQVSHLKDQSAIDSLTKLMNRHTLDKLLETWTKQGRTFSIIMLDIDHFKAVNDTFGHTVGDEVLQFLAKTMKEMTREQDICCRYGGEEFMILLPDTPIQHAYKVAERLRKTLESTNSPCGRPITISSGIASFPGPKDMTDLIQLADKALYEAKRTGRNRTIIATQ